MRKCCLCRDGGVASRGIELMTPGWAGAMPTQPLTGILYLVFYIFLLLGLNKLRAEVSTRKSIASRIFGAKVNSRRTQGARGEHREIKRINYLCRIKEIIGITDMKSVYEI